MKNVPNAEFEPNGNFCFKNNSRTFNIRDPANIILCTEIYAGKYLLYQQQNEPDQRNGIVMREMYVYGKPAKNNEIDGNISGIFLVLIFIDKRFFFFFF